MNATRLGCVLLLSAISGCASLDGAPAEDNETGGGEAPHNPAEPASTAASGGGGQGGEGASAPDAGGGGSDAGGGSDSVGGSDASGGGPASGTVSDADGNTYGTIQIGTQVWMTENLATNTADSFFYDDNPSYGPTYGRLYTQAAALSACMPGWHLPSDQEWMELEIYLGMTPDEAATDWSTNDMRGTDEGGALKETGTSLWETPNAGATNATGFSARPGGFRGYGGGYDAVGRDGRYWSSTASRYLRWDRPHINRYLGGPLYGFSVRCLKD